METRLKGLYLLSSPLKRCAHFHCNSWFAGVIVQGTIFSV